jgi:hypothetical protein
MVNNGDYGSGEIVGVISDGSTSRELRRALGSGCSDIEMFEACCLSATMHGGRLGKLTLRWSWGCGLVLGADNRTKPEGTPVNDPEALAQLLTMASWRKVGGDPPPRPQAC